MLDLLSQPPGVGVTALILVVLSTMALHFSSRFRTRKYPPGPPGTPFIGHLRDLATKPPHLYYTELSNVYGDVVHVSAMGQPIILVGSWEAANQLLGKRGNIYSDRPPAQFNNFVLNLNHILPTAAYGPMFKEARRMYHVHLSRENSRLLYRADIEAEACNYVLRSIQEGRNFPGDYDRALQKTFLNSVYGIKVTSDDDDFLKTAIVGTDIASASLVPGRYLVNNFPWLMHVPSWFPGTGWKQEGKIGAEILDRMIYAPFNKVRQAEAEGSAKQSFTLSMIRESTTLSEELLAKAAGATFVAGAETTSSFIQYFIYAMLMYPEIQKKAQDELDRVVGRDRLPNIDDYAELPYLEAIVKEISRWRPVAPISVPHQVTKDDVYKGYLIPKGAIVIQNTWAMCNNEKMYPNAAEFNPDRFMVKDPPMDPRLYTFGVGRRICPGINYAEVVYVTVMATMLSTVDIVKARDANGKEIYVQPGAPGKGKLINAPIPFAYQFRPRSDTAMNLLRLGPLSVGA